MKTILSIIAIFIVVMIIAFIITQPIISIILVIGGILFFFGMRKLVDKKVHDYIEQRKKEDSDK